MLTDFSIWSLLLRCREIVRNSDPELATLLNDLKNKMRAMPKQDIAKIVINLETANLPDPEQQAYVWIAAQYLEIFFLRPDGPTLNA